MMSRIERHGFEQPLIDIIKEAFLFLKKKISLYGENVKKGLDRAHHSVVDEEIKREIGKIERIEAWFDTEGSRFVFTMREDVFQEFMNATRSALEIYLRDTREAKTKSSVAGFDKRIEGIERVIHLDAVKEGRTGLFDKYYEIDSARAKNGTKLHNKHPPSKLPLPSKEKAIEKQREIKVDELVFPKEILERLPVEVQKTIEGVRLCYEHDHADFCFMGMRKILGTAIHIRFKRDGIGDALYDEEGEPYKLDKMLELAKQNRYISANLARKLGKEVKVFGDIGSHDYMVVFTREMYRRFSNFSGLL